MELSQLVPRQLMRVSATTLICLSALSACSSSEGSEPLSDASTYNSTRDNDPLIGAWTYTGNVPARVTLVATINADGTFNFVEHVAPFSRPIGVPDNACVTTDTYAGTYAESGTNTLTWTITSSTVNAISPCTPNDIAGTPVDLTAVDAFRAQGLIPAASVSYVVTADSLVLTPGLGAAASTTFSKVATSN